MKTIRLFLTGLFALVLVASCATDRTAETVQADALAAAPETTTLNVALYPYVPRIDQFQKAITDAWGALHPDVALNFIPASEWDGGYSSDPQPNYDVFIFDGMFFEYFKAQGYLSGIPAASVTNPDDFLAYARDGVTEGSTFYAIPFLGCSNVFFYNKNDAALADATTLSEIAAALGSGTYTSQEPPDRRGTMLDMAGGTTNATLYLDVAYNQTGVYPLPQPAPADLSAAALATMTKLIGLASYWNVTMDPPDDYGRGVWYNSGFGRSYVGFTESMSVMSPETRANIAFRIMPFSDETGYGELFYADVIGVNSKTSQSVLAVELANLIATTDVFVASTGATGSNAPQFLMATRVSAFQELAKQDAIYKQMYALITDNQPLMFKLDKNARSWVDSVKQPIKTASRTPFTGACDFQSASYIPGQSQAPALCTAACSGHGGWNGQWTNEYPAAPPGQSVCGCNACPVPN